jgi:aspartyl-tRNA(Asn)/glutamyl-tRNA(Gln) amidotransferase subunit B
VPVAPDAAWVERLRTTLPELPPARRARLAGELGATDFEMESMANAGVVELVAATAAAGAPADEARNWWLGYLTQKANAAEIEPADLAIGPEQVARVVALVEDGTLSVGLARQAVDGVLETGADVDTVVAERGLRECPMWTPLPPRWTRRSRPSRTWPRRSAPARWPPPARWSAR